MDLSSNDYGLLKSNKKSVAPLNKLCTKCGINPAAKYNQSWCRPCLASLEGDRRKRLKEIGICVICGGDKKAEPGINHCRDCQTTINTRCAARVYKTKTQAVALLGGACVDCGLCTKRVEVYDFHHLDESTKEFNPSYVLRTQKDKALSELSKCVLLCSNCHRMRHASKYLEYR